MGLAVSACVNAGQIANLADSPTAAVAFESIDGPPATVSQQLVRNLEDEARARRIAVVSPGEARYRLRGYLATHGASADGSIAWTLDVYDAGQRRAFRLSGQEKAAGGTWSTVDDRVLQSVAHQGVDQLAAFLADGRKAAAAAAPPAAAQRASLIFGVLDDWAPESVGIFRLLRRGTAAPEIAADAGAPLPPEEVQLPAARPAPAAVRSDEPLAFAAER